MTIRAGGVMVKCMDSEQNTPSEKMVLKEVVLVRKVSDIMVSCMAKYSRHQTMELLMKETCNMEKNMEREALKSKMVNVTKVISETTNITAKGNFQDLLELMRVISKEISITEMGNQFYLMALCLTQVLLKMACITEKESCQCKLIKKRLSITDFSVKVLNTEQELKNQNLLSLMVCGRWA